MTKSTPRKWADKLVDLADRLAGWLQGLVTVPVPVRVDPRRPRRR